MIVTLKGCDDCLFQAFGKHYGKVLQWHKRWLWYVECK